MFWVVRVQAGGEDWSDGSKPERRGYNTKGEQGVKNVSDETSKIRETGLKYRGDGIEGAVGEFNSK